MSLLFPFLPYFYLIFQVGPGVLARLTPGGTSYVSAFVARALANELLTTRAPDEINSTMVGIVNKRESETFFSLNLCRR